MSKNTIVATNGLYSTYVGAINDTLRSYLFTVYADVENITPIVRNIKWSDSEIIVETLVYEDANKFNRLVGMKELRITFLDRVGNNVLSDTFAIKGIKNKYPMEVSHESKPSTLVYRIVFKY
jgi:hypothetical protein